MSKFSKGKFTMNRRAVMAGIGAGSAGLAMGALPTRVIAEDTGEIIRSHGYSFFGDLSYPADFPHFDYVNPNAPKGGEISLSTRGTFDGLNRFAWKGRPGLYSGLIVEAMFSRSPFGDPVPADSLTEAYCHLAEAVEYPKTKEWCVFHMRPEAKFSDGSPLTAHDAAFSHNLFLEQGIRSYARAVKQRISGVEVIDDHTLKYTFVDGISRRSLISQVGGTPVFSKAWYERTGERLDEPSINIQLGSGPYVVDDFEVNRYIVYKRNPDYWGWHLPVNVGRHNFDRVRVEYFLDETAEFEAFKAGEYTFRQENSTKRWATGYDFPALDRGHVKQKRLENGTPPTPSGLIFNVQRALFKDKDVREALSLAFNFEWVSASLQYGLTTQRHSFSQGTQFEAKGVPEGLEKAFLESLGDVVPEEMMTTQAVRAHSSDGSSVSDRRNQRKASRLLRKAGWRVGDDGKMKNEAGEVMALTVMLPSSGSDTVKAITDTYAQTLNDWGIDARVERIDSAQYRSRFLDKDYDMIYGSNQPLASVGTGLMQSYGSEQAVVSSYNPQSLQSELVDAIIEAALNTNSQDEEDAALRALDRALRYLRLQIHAGYVPEYWVASYDMFEHPENLPQFALGALDFWWFNQEKYEALQAAGALR